MRNLAAIFLCLFSSISIALGQIVSYQELSVNGLNLSASVVQDVIERDGVPDYRGKYEGDFGPLSELIIYDKNKYYFDSEGVGLNSFKIHSGGVSLGLVRINVGDDYTAVLEKLKGRLIVMRLPPSKEKAGMVSLKVGSLESDDYLRIVFSSGERNVEKIYLWMDN